MAGEIFAGDDALKVGAAQVAKSRAELKQQLKALEGNLAGIGGKWKGQGAVAFSALMVRWNEDANKIINSLDVFEANLLSSQSTYTAADDAQATSMSRLTGRLG
jgi:WXG100 family type VII secretion target